MTDNPTLRVVLDIFLVILIAFGYWYIALAVALIAGWAFSFYAELVLFGLVFDALFGMGRGLGLVGYLGTIIAVVLFAAVSFLKLIVRK